jgi:hypothetical protein
VAGTQRAIATKKCFRILILKVSLGDINTFKISPIKITPRKVIPNITLPWQLIQIRIKTGNR